jgi:hypothetical protein
MPQRSFQNPARFIVVLHNETNIFMEAVFSGMNVNVQMNGYLSVIL